MTTLLIILLGAFLPYSPLAVPLGFVPLPGSFWAFMALTLVCYVGLTQLVKTWLIRKSWV
jgi:Mg2+-importing ATPase